MVLKIIKVHLKDEKHPLKLVMDEFKNIFIDSYKRFVDKNTDTPENLIKALTNLNDWEKS